ncbi:MAG TPA: hypothetical protein VEZ55_11455 [Chitinophagaceae bacterium]|jgi:hypothetical protein|nr:hypothetical protein [Chitinophagaceae bacterium]
MQEQNKQAADRPDDMAHKGTGQQGIDKAPGEETSQSIDPVVYETQKGKNKVDGDPTQESDQPIDQP